MAMRIFLQKFTQGLAAKKWLARAQRFFVFRGGFGDDAFTLEFSLPSNTGLL